MQAPQVPAPQQELQQELPIAIHPPPRDDFFSMDTPGASSNSEVAILEQGDKPGMNHLHTSKDRSSSGIFHEIEFNKQSRVLTLGFVLPICYFLTCGGPTGIEPIVVSSSPLLTLIGLLAYPVCVSIPFGLLISEMCTAFPDDGGYVIWATNAFGPFWGFQQGFWSWVSTVLNNALYPGFILEALTSVIGSIESPMVEYLLKVAIAIVISLPTLFGTKFVGQSSALLFVLVIAPFIVATPWFFGQAQDFGVLAQMPSDAEVVPAKEVNWKLYISQLFWSYDGMYIVSLFGGQIANPSHTYPRAIFITLLMTVVTYLLPIAGALVVNDSNWWRMEDGFMARVASVVGGSLLHSLLVFSAVCSNVGLFASSVFAKCYLVNGMARQGLVPSVLSKRHYFFETPYLALMANTLPVLLVMTFDFKVLVDAGNCISAASQILMMVAAIKLRIMHGDNYQFKKFPGGNPVVIISMIIPMAVVGYVFVVSLAYVAAIVVVIGVVYGAIRLR